MDRVDFQRITILHKKINYHIQVNAKNTFGYLQYLIFKTTGVKPHLQCFENPELKEKLIPHSCEIEELNLKDDLVLILTEIKDQAPSISKKALMEIKDQVPSTSSKKPEDSLIVTKTFLVKESSEYSLHGIKILNNARESMKLVVLDLDKTIYDYDVPKNTPEKFAIRPSLSDFLTTIYQYYDIIIWSATMMSGIEQKMEKVFKHSQGTYKIMAYVDIVPLVVLTTPQFGTITAKPLRFIWEKFSQYNQKNTIICDDMPTTFHCNQENGIAVVPYSYMNYSADNELIKLTTYLKHLARDCEDFSTEDHSSWRTYPQLRKRN